MDAADDPIRALLEKTGLSCDDLLQKLIIFKSQEKTENEGVNNDGVSSGKTSDSSVNDVCNSDIVESSKCKNAEEYHQNGDHSSVINSSDIHNSTEENCDEPLPSDILYKKKNVNATNIDDNSALNISEDFESTSQEYINCSTKSEENIVKDAETKEICYKTIESDKKPKRTDKEIHRTTTLPKETQVESTNIKISAVEILPSSNIKIGNLSNTTTLPNETSNLHRKISCTQLTENINIKNVESNISSNTSFQSSENNCSEENNNKETQVKSTNIKISAVDIFLSSNLKIRNLSNTTTLPNETSNLHRERSRIQLTENINIKNAESGISSNTSIQSSEDNYSKENKNKETQVKSTNNVISAVDILTRSNFKILNLSNETNKHNAAFISTRKSISDQLVRRLSQRIDEDNITISEDEQATERSNVDKTIENIRDVDCLEKNETKIIEPVPLLKFRSDLFLNGDRKSPTNSPTSHDNIEEVQMSHQQDYLSEEENNSSEKNTSEKILAVNHSETGILNTKIRKVKVGFLKKKILSKAIKHLSRVDSVKHKIQHCKETTVTNSESDIEYSFPRPLPKLILEPQVDTPEAQEEIRKNLKLQLNSLRNRRKSDNITEQGQCNKFQSISDLKFNYKKQLLNEDVPNSPISSQSISAACTDMDESQLSPSSRATEHYENNFTEVSGNDVSSLFSLSEETNFMIVDVQGGVEFPENEYNVGNEDFQNDSIKLTKTNDITKIKGWKNKKFDMATRKSNSQKKATENCLEEMNACDTIAATSGSKDDSISTEIMKKKFENGTEELSPFVSNTLEEFLTENSRLNISYKIPKLGAEEGLREVNFKDILLPKNSKLPQAKTSTETKEKDKLKGIKAKTLAEKRRILEGRLSKGCRAKDAYPLNISKSSYIYFNGRKLFVPSTSCSKCLANIRFKPAQHIKQNRLINKSYNTENETTPKKLSLLKLLLEESKILTYKPGPLSKKQKLQNSATISSWDTVVQKLPKVKLEIIHEFEKKIPPFLVSFLPKPGTIIKSDYLEFALSAVHTKSSKHSTQGFRFSIPYKNNQKYILMGRRKEESADSIACVCDIEPERNSVASVIDDIIKYVEIKELGDSIIKDAEPYVEEECEVEPSPVMQNDINVVEDDIAKKSIKRRKLEMELQRLSCKVVSVTVEDKEIMNTDCNKSYCKLGCICRSLTSTSHLPFNYQHCSKKECMFECKCSAANGDVSLSGDISVLSSDTVTRIEDQAKRNLARVEKEFTQTIIHANDKTILIPSSDRNKTKRPKRAPKRYSDFLENCNVEQENAIEPKENKKSKMWQNFELFSCFVKLQKLDIKSVVPLCLDHNCYDCYCLKNIVTLNENKNNSNDEENVPPKKLKKLNNDEEHVEENVPPKKLKKVNDDEKNVGENAPPKKLKKLNNDEKNVEQNVPPIKLKKLKKDDGTKKNESNTNLKKQSSTRSDPENDNISNSIGKVKQCEGCARIRAVRPEISARNEIPFYKNKLRVRIKNYQKQNKCPSPINMQYEENDSNIIDVTTPLIILASDRLKYFLNECKRKQVHEVRDDWETAHSSGKVKKMNKQHNSVQEFSSKPIKEPITQSELPYARIFDGEIVIPTNANKDFVRNLGVKSVAPYMRLLTWNDLLKNFYSKKIHIWCSLKSDKVLINRRHIKPPEGYVDIKKSSRRNGIMMWILAKELPKRTPPELVHLILSPNKNHFEISGICLKNTPNSQEGHQIEKINDQKHNEDKPDHIEEIDEIVTGNTNAQKPDNQDSNVLEHKNHNNELSVLFLTKHEFSPQYFYLAEIGDIYNEKLSLTLELPVSHTDCRWRMLYLNSNFSLLSFIGNKYSIKYTDLMFILKEAQNSNKTIFLNSKQLSSGYSHKYFGIYAVPKYGDRLFIGPYGMKEEHGLETLRYLRKSLVTTSYFEMIQGIANPGNKNALWLSTRKTIMLDSSQLSLLHRQTQHSPLKSNMNKVCIDRKEKANNSRRENEDLALLTPILNLNSPMSNSHSSIDDETVALSELRSTSFSETDEQSDQRIELQGIHEHSKLLVGCDTFISSTDLQDKPFIKFPEFILLNEKKLKPEDYNRYIMTNIPYFGYLGANKTEQSKSIYVNWPFGDKTLQFPSVTAAFEFLRRRFTNLLLPIPASFQMNFIILREIDPSYHSPIKAKILNGTHICGEFGVLDSRQLTSTLAKSLGTTQDDVLKRLAKRAHYLVRCRLRTLGLFLLPKDEKLGEVLDNVAYVTNLGALEIAKLKEQEKKLIDIKRDLILRKQKNLTKFMELLMHLPEKQRLEEYDKFRHQFNGRGKQNNIETNQLPNADKKQESIECIEIEDSDSENETSDNIPGTTKVSGSLQSSSSSENDVAVKSCPPVFGQTSCGIRNNAKDYKFIKSASGKLVLLKHNSGSSFSTSLSGMKMTIRNNKVVWRNKNVDTNSDIQGVEETSIDDNNHSDEDEVEMRNCEEDSVVTVNESNESDIEILE